MYRARFNGFKVMWVLEYDNDFVAWFKDGDACQRCADLLNTK